MTLVEDADTAGRHYAATTTKGHKKALGQYLTGPDIAAFMAAGAAKGLKGTDTVRVLDPAAGGGILAVAACEALAALPHPPRVIEVVAYEIDPPLAWILRDLLERTAHALAPRINVVATVIEKDFVLANAEVLTRDLYASPTQLFDLVISNPPYFKLAKSSPQARACESLVYGQPNIYQFFMGICACLIRPGGQFCFITPRSWAAGPYFELFRKRFFAQIRPETVHVFASRRGSFKRDEILQEVEITWGVRDDGWLSAAPAARMTMSTSEGSHDLATSEVRTIPLIDLLDSADRHLVLRLPASEAHDRIIDLVHSWPSSLARYGFKISTGPVVSFRANEYLATEPEDDTVPLLWLQNVRAMVSTWPIGMKKAEYVRKSDQSAYILVPNKAYILIRRFSAKEEARRLVAAPYEPITGFESVGLENHLNYVYRPNGVLTVDEVWGLSALLNSETLDAYFRCVNGNTQVSATELRAMPMPPVEMLLEIGRRARGITDLPTIDDIVASVLYRERETAVA